MSGFARGFKTRAERLAIEVRREIGLTAYDPLDPRRVAEHLGIEVVSLVDMAAWGLSEASIRQFVINSPGDLSAMTLMVGGMKLIIENSRHSTGRRSSSLAHELAHILLGHKAGPALGEGGCRRWSDSDEAEADWLAGALLVPRLAAVRIAQRGTAHADAAREYGVSLDMMTWRINHTGARVQALRGRRVKAMKVTSRHTSTRLRQ